MRDFQHSEHTSGRFESSIINLDEYMHPWDIISFIWSIWPANAQWYTKAIFPSFDFSSFFSSISEALASAGTGYGFPVQSGETIYGSAFNSPSR